MCTTGKSAAHITAKMVIASAALLIDVLHFCLNSKRTAEISVPACPIPTHHTKLVMSQAHPTVLFKPHIPIPCHKVIQSAYPPTANKVSETAMANIHDLEGLPSTCLQMSSVTSDIVLPPVTKGSRTGEVTCILFFISY